MIEKFTSDTVLLLIDVQKGVDRLEYWSGKTGRRNNPDAEANMQRLLNRWRQKRLPVAYTLHDSRESASPLKLSEPGGAIKEGFEPMDGDLIIYKDVNSGFIGSKLELELRRQGIHRLVVVGFFTNMCVETTVRMAGNLGFDTYLVPAGCACSNRIGADGTDYDPQLIHAITVANLHGEFCTTLDIEDALGLLERDAEHLARAQGNE